MAIVRFLTLLCLIAAAPVVASDWQRPVSAQAEADWFRTSWAVDDGPLARLSPALHLGWRRGPGAWLTCELAAPIRMDALRLRAAAHLRRISGLEVQRRDADGHWVAAYSGPLRAEVSLAAGWADAVRIRVLRERAPSVFLLFDLAVRGTVPEPSLRWLSPAPGATLAWGQAVDLQVEGVDLPDPAAAVRFALGDLALGDVRGPRATLAWNPEISGDHALVASLRLDDGRLIEAALPVTVAEPQVVLYRETFPMRDGTHFRRPLESFGWSGMAWYSPVDQMTAEHGTRVTGSVGLEGVNNQPYSGEDVQDGALYISNTHRTILLHTHEYQDLDIGQVDQIHFMITARRNTPVYLAVQIDGAWYVSAEPYVVQADNLITEVISGPEAFEHAVFTLAETGFNNLIVLDTGLLKRGTAGPFPLPGRGQLTGFGTFTQKNYSNKYAIDDYTIIGRPHLPRGSFALSLPETSPISPLFIEGSRADGQAVSGQVTGSGGTHSLAIGGLSERHLWADVPLDPAAAAQVQVQAGEITVSRCVTWAPTPVGDDHEITLRAGDALLLRWPDAASEALVHLESGALDPVDLSQGRTQPYRFRQPGHYQFTALGPLGEIGRLFVVAVGVDVPQGRACEFAYTRDFSPGTVQPSQAADQVSLWSPAEARRVGLVPHPQEAGQYRLTPVTHGQVQIAARLGSHHGPILATESVQVFTLRTSAEQYLGVIERFPDGSVLVGATLTMTPLVPALDVRLHIFAPGITFSDSTLDLSLNSSTFTSHDDGHGTAPYEMIMDPATFHAGPCHTITVFEGDVQIGGE